MVRVTGSTITVGELREALAKVPDNVPVYAWADYRDDDGCYAGQDDLDIISADVERHPLTDDFYVSLCTNGKGDD